MARFIYNHFQAEQNKHSNFIAKTPASKIKEMKMKNDLHPINNCERCMRPFYLRVYQVIFKGKKVIICVQCAEDDLIAPFFKFGSFTNILATEKALQVHSCEETARYVELGEKLDCAYMGQGIRKIERLDNWRTNETNLTFTQTTGKAEWALETIKKVNSEIKEIRKQMIRTSSLAKREMLIAGIEKREKRISELSKKLPK